MKSDNIFTILRLLRHTLTPLTPLIKGGTREASVASF